MISDVPIIVWDTREGSDSERMVQGKGPLLDELIAQFKSGFGFRLRSPASDPVSLESGSKVPNQFSNQMWVWTTRIIGTVLNVYAAAGSARTNDFIDNSQPCDHEEIV